MGMKIKPYIDLSSKVAGKIIEVTEQAVKSPQQRLILGSTALVTMPIIEAKNPNANEDQKTLAISKTFAKIIAGTTSGFAIRKACNNFIASRIENMESGLNPKNFLNLAVDEIERNKTAVFGNTIGTFVASFVMVLTNYLWDAPVTKHLTNFFYKHATNRKERN
ncbi:MAG: hypothetical protein PHE78_06680 [Candidatus Gastranaerophilales bacterium]|nr:hypothetical protein [Candidatus Gastranaerophilales bacterium]